MRKCNCSGACGPPGLSRRDFIELMGTGATGALLASPAWGQFALPDAEWARWKEDLLQPGRGRVYQSDRHTDARLHLGGIGTGNFELGADGQLTTWQLFNTLRDGTVPFYFAVRAGGASFLLQTAGGPAVPRVQRIEMTGEYPVARLRYIEPALPVELELEAFSPFAPLAVEISSVPVAAFVFRIRNRSGAAERVSLGAFLQNPVGYDAAGPNAGDLNPAFGGNFNEPFGEGDARGVVLAAVAGLEPQLDQPVRLVYGPSLGGLTGPPADRPPTLSVVNLENLAPAEARPSGEKTLIWLEEPAADFPEPRLRRAREAVSNGAVLVLAGRSLPLLGFFARATGGRPPGEPTGRPDIVFDDFESGYAKWKITGNAFGDAPATGTLPNQQRVSGFAGGHLVNTYLEGDGTTGRAVSSDFVIERRFIRFLVGGGGHAGTQVRLLVDGQVVRQSAGRNNERLELASWEVGEFEGRTGHLEIVDEATGGWGHVNVDQVEFSDTPAEGAMLALLDELLPIRFAGVRPVAGDHAGAAARVEFEQMEPREGTRQETGPGGLPLFIRPVGRGRVVLAAGEILAPELAGTSSARQTAYATLCGLVGARYVPPAGQHPQAPGFGSLALAVTAGEPTLLARAGNWEGFWERFSRDGRLESFDQAKRTTPSDPGQTSSTALATQVTVEPGAVVEVPFLLGWHYPNKFSGDGTWMGCHYTRPWRDAGAVMREAVARFTDWRERTGRFRRTFYDSTLPWWVLDAVTANAAIIRHVGVVFRIHNGDCYGWEGSNGCCQPTCTHVWGYEQTLSRLFPELERDMRRIDFQHQQSADGGVNNRTDVPSPAHPTGEHPFADGHASCILKAYREALNSVDDGFFREYWPAVRRAVEYLVARDAASHTGEPAGYLEDDQWNTYDEALHGVTTFISGYYLAALRAGEEWARRMGEVTVAERWRAVFDRGRGRLVDLCWNGEYFQQHLPGYEQRAGEVGPGCMSDQLIGQWWAHQLGLGYLLPREQVVSALKSVYRHNFKTDLTGWRHMPRAFAGAGDKGLIICTWPKGGRPREVMLYSDEVWTGIEYQVAAHMIYEGMIEEGLAIAKAARDRYDGVPRPPISRNPWNEIECGGHYARAMSSWSLLSALSGWEYDGPRQLLRFGPRVASGNFRSFFCAPEGWGTAQQRDESATRQVELRVVVGRLGLARARLDAPAGPREASVFLDNRRLTSNSEFASGTVTVILREPVTVNANEVLRVTLA